MTWPGWNKSAIKQAIWLSDMTKTEQHALKMVFLRNITVEKLTKKSGFGNRNAEGIRKLARRAAEKFCKALELAGGIPVAPQIFNCWMEDVFNRSIYHAPSHVRIMLSERKRRKKEEWQ